MYDYPVVLVLVTEVPVVLMMRLVATLRLTTPRVLLFRRLNRLTEMGPLQELRHPHYGTVMLVLMEMWVPMVLGSMVLPHLVLRLLNYLRDGMDMM